MGCSDAETPQPHEYEDKQWSWDGVQIIVLAEAASFKPIQRVDKVGVQTDRDLGEICARTQSLVPVTRQGYVWIALNFHLNEV